MRWRNVPDLQIDAISFLTLFGGGTDAWAPLKDETINFGNFKLYEALPIVVRQPAPPPDPGNGIDHQPALDAITARLDAIEARAVAHDTIVLTGPDGVVTSRKD